MEDFSIHVHNVQKADISNARARRKALQRSKTGNFTVSLTPKANIYTALRTEQNGILNITGLRRSGSENSLIDVKYLDHSRTQRKRRMDGRLPPPPPNKDNIFPIHTPPSTPRRVLRSSILISPMVSVATSSKKGIPPLFE
jgi:hypothetical protein